MYENVTYEYLMEQMLSRVSINYPEIDVREGSMMWNAVSPAAVELARIYTELDNVLNESFAQTATREFLFKKCEEVGIDTSVFDATNAVFYADFNVQVPIGSRWNYDKYNFEVTEYVGVVDGNHRYYVKSETSGSEVNDANGTMTPIDNSPEGLTYAVLVSCEVLGEDARDTESIRSYYFDYVSRQAIDGNVAQYELWCQDYVGIGNFKIIPLWNGSNTVKVSILGADNKAASSTLVTEFQEYLDPPTSTINDTTTAAGYPQGRGMGNGKAPIGAIVTVTTATELPLNMTASVSIKSGYTADTVKANIDASVVKYLSSIAYETSKVAYMSLGAAIMSADGVDYISDFLINGASSDVALTDEQCPVIGTTSWTVVS